MKLAMNGATTMKADLKTDIEAISKAGFDYIEIWASKLRDFLKENSIEQLSQLLEENSLKPYSINSIEHITFRTKEEYEKIKSETKELSEIASKINCPYVVVVPGKKSSQISKDEIIDESVRVLNELADIAEAYNVSLAFEFLGQTDCSVQTLGLCNEIIEKVDRESVGIVIDTFHFYAGDSSFDEIERVNPEKIFIFHINDAENIPKSQLTDAHRLYPGEGILPIKQIKDRLIRIGYDRVASVEIFRPEYWEQNPFEVARKAKESAEKALELR
ncbi:MAG: sugar phosphate isomerase/epimerase [Acidobacteriota bacterium]|nr:sugar phosphate isomerase/epimerase [Pyrinomonadaceae bacterium]MDW8304403.1 sugar phosphate isomerase/epimerase [Acidobacteriota bacterium]